MAGGDEASRTRVNLQILKLIWNKRVKLYRVMKILCWFLNDLLFIYCFLVSTETDVQRAKKRAQQKQIMIKKIANMMANGIKVCVQVNYSVFY